MNGVSASAGATRVWTPVGGLSIFTVIEAGAPWWSLERQPTGWTFESVGARRVCVADGGANHLRAVVGRRSRCSGWVRGSNVRLGVRGLAGFAAVVFAVVAVAIALGAGIDLVEDHPEEICVALTQHR